MGNYFLYLRDMIIAVFTDIGKWFAAPWIDVSDNFSNYGDIFGMYSSEFGFWGWFFFALFALLFTALIGAGIFGLYLLIRKYVRFCKREYDKEELVEQVEKLSYMLQLSDLERKKVLDLKVTAMGLDPNALNKEGEENPQEGSVRFPKLCHVDELYKGVSTEIAVVPDLSLEELCNAFRNFAASKLKLYYKIDVIRQLFAGMATSKLIILEGISGTGKTSLAYALGKFFNYDSAIIPVQPSWKDRSELLGYYNEFTKKFNESEFLRALYTCTYRKDLDVIVLDEMNLARIEYYFAEFLSIMEMRDTNEWLIDLIPAPQSDDPTNIKEGKLLIPQNVEFFGTANNDDSTFTISDKVYDRAISIFFDDKGREFECDEQESMFVPYAQLSGLYHDALSQFPISENMLSKFEELDNFVIKNFKLAFGNRIMKQLDTFIPVYVACGGTEMDGFDFIFTNKVLKKFESLNIAFLKDELNQLNAELDKLYGKGNFKMAHAYVDNLIKNN
jgi:SpoVK/Ycf46/Vps4 family AAA+-type ATPase